MIGNVKMTLRLKLNRKLTHEKLKELLHYDPKTGLFIWLRLLFKNQVKVGDVAGLLRKDGYINIQIFGKTYFAHRLAWFYMTSLVLHER